MRMRTVWRWSMPVVIICAFLLIAGPTRLLSIGISNVAWVGLVKARAEQKQTASMPVNWFERALRTDLGNRSARRGLGFAHLQKGRPTAAVVIWQQTDGMGRELYHMGRQAERVQRAQPVAGNEAADRSLEWYNLATQVDPLLRDPWFRVGQLHEQQERWSAAEQAYRSGLESTHGVHIGSSDLLFWLARIVEKHHTPPDLVGAMTFYDQALAEDAFGDPWVQAQTYYRRGEILLGRGQLQEAEQAYETLIALNPKSYWGVIQLAAVVQTLDGDPAYVEELLQQAIQLDAEQFVAYRQLGLLYQQVQRSADAKSMYEKALALNPDDVLSREQLQAIQE